jgi:2,3-bisphosphoglycerate-independent phosphoglycerate mutase
LPPFTLVILDGWGVSKQTRGNAILAARTPNYKKLLDKFPNTLLEASGCAVGLPPGLMGNSEVGHLNIGAGRVVIQKLTQISETILNGSFFTNPVLVAAVEDAQVNKQALHLTGLVSDGCVHSSPDHLEALLELAARSKAQEIIVHPILDGRDTPPKSAKRFIRQLEKLLAEKLPGRGKIGVVSGRYYAMDRDNRWERTERFWQALVMDVGEKFASAEQVIESNYEKGISDEFVPPAIVSSRPLVDGDSLICFNFRPDRVRQISRCLTVSDFTGFSRPVNPQIHYACLTEYDHELNLPVAFSPAQLPSQDMKMTLPELLHCHHIGQFHTAETEKYAHVTYFLNGGREVAYAEEERVLVQSLKVATYDLAPQMQTPEVCREAVKAINSAKYPFIVLNFANPDMVGHTGIMEAAIEAVESVDLALGELLEATSANKGTLFITADHGNVEQMIDFTTGEPHTAHTTNPVPLVVADFSGQLKANLPLSAGALADVAPTALPFLQLDKPEEMTGRNLFSLVAVSL